MSLKEYFCFKGHQFNGKDSKEWMNDRDGEKLCPFCPICWPQGFKENELTIAEKKSYDRIKCLIGET